MSYIVVAGSTSVKPRRYTFLAKPGLSRSNQIPPWSILKNWEIPGGVPRRKEGSCRTTYPGIAGGSNFPGMTGFSQFQPDLSQSRQFYRSCGTSLAVTVEAASTILEIAYNMMELSVLKHHVLPLNLPYAGGSMSNMMGQGTTWIYELYFVYFIS